MIILLFLSPVLNIVLQLFITIKNIQTPDTFSSTNLISQRLEQIKLVSFSF